MLRLDRNSEKVEEGSPLVNVSKLGGSRDIEYPNIADGDFVAHEVWVDLHVLRPLMLDGVGGEIHGADVVA